MKKAIRIGTRDSQLALWQANTVKSMLERQGLSAELVHIKSEGDLRTDKPLYQLGITGVFTRALDLALLEDRIDVAVHSMKDVPTILPEGIVVGAVLERADPHDVLVHKGLDFLNTDGCIATGSLRRRAQWLHRYPLHEVVNLRGNVPGRLQKLRDNNWNGAIFAAAGLNRLQLAPENLVTLKWMLPAPAQGAVMVVTKRQDEFCQQALKEINHTATEVCTMAERDFLRELEGGCSAPIGALAEISGKHLRFRGEVLSVDGQQRVAIDREFPLETRDACGKEAALQVLKDGGRSIMEEIKSQLNP